MLLVHLVGALLAAGAHSPVQAQETARATIAAIHEVLPSALNGWRFQHPAEPRGEQPGLDDSRWPLVNLEHQWEGANTEAWYRKTIVVPKTALDLSGSALELLVQADDDGEIYVNGQLRQRFHWDDGRVVLTDSGRPGQEFLVAVRVINQGGPGRLRAARLSYPRLDAVRPTALAAAGDLVIALNLVQAEDPAGASSGAAVDAAAQALDLPALARGDQPAFAASVLHAREQLAPLAKVAKQYTLYLVGHAHIDMNWLWLWPETVEVCRATWTQVVQSMDEFPGFRFSQSQPQVYRAIQEQYPDLFAQMRQRIAEGRWELTGGTWVECDMNMPSGEALVRQCLLSREYDRQTFGRVPGIGWSPDTFGHAWTVPQILADCGLRNYYFMRAGNGLPLFWWQGPDGSRLLAYTTDNYNERIARHLQLVPLRLEPQAKVKDAMVVYGVGDHGGGPTREDIENALRLSESPAFPNVRFATTSEFYDSVRKQNPDLPVVADELNFIFERCYTTHADIKRENRELEYTIPAAETLAAMAGRCGASYPAVDFEQAWRNTCFNQFHDVLCGTAIAASYEYSKGLYEEALGAARRALDGAADALLAQTDTRGPGDAIAVYNALGWLRTDYAEAEVKTPAKPAAIDLRGPDGKPVAAQIIETRADGQAWVTRFGFIARNVPAVGYAVYHARPGSAAAFSLVAQPSKAANGRSLGRLHHDQKGLANDRRSLGRLRHDQKDLAILTSARYDLGVDLASGQITRLVDRSLQRNLVPPGKALDVLQAHLEEPNGMSAWTIGHVAKVIDLSQASDVRVVERGPVRATIEVKHPFRQSSFVQRIRLYEGVDRLDFDLTADWREIGTGEQGGVMMKVAFPLALDNPRATFEIPFGAIERAPNGAEVPAQKWIDVTAQEIRAATREGVAPRALDLTPYFNNDGFATVQKPGDGDLDRGGASYPAEMLPGQAGDVVTLAHAPLRIPPTGDGQLNNIACGSQKIAIDAAGPTLIFFGAATNGGHSGPLTLNYADGSSATALLAFSDWCSGAAPDEVTVLSKGFRRRASGQEPVVVYLRARKVPTDPARRLRSIVLSQQPDLHLVGIAIGPKTLRVPTYGVSLLNDCKYGHDVLGSQMRLTLLRCPSNPDPRPDFGVHHIRYSLLPHPGDWRQDDTVRRAYELNTPLVIRHTTAHPGKLPRAVSFLSVGPANCVLSVVKRAEDGEGLIVRFYESAGQRCRADVSFRTPVARAIRTNSVEQAIGNMPVSVSGRAIRLPVKPHEIVTLRVVPR